MKAMIINKVGSIVPDANPLDLAEMPHPVPGVGEVLIKVNTCGVCHTEIDEIEGRAMPAFFPLIPGHQVVGKVVVSNMEKGNLAIGERVGVAWIYHACGTCEHCKAGNENLCAQFQATGRDMHGGYAEFMKAPGQFVYRIPEALSDLEAAPLLCAGAIGYRALRLTGIGNGEALGLTGFGASAHLVLKMLTHKFPDTKVYVFARSASERRFARELGAVWSGEATERPPVLLDAIIDTTPVWQPVLEGLSCLKPGGRIIINAIRKETIDQEALLTLDYGKHLWMEKEVKSVANITRKDVEEFLHLAAEIPIKPRVQEYALEDANRALKDLKLGHVKGAKVLRVTE